MTSETLLTLSHLTILPQVRDTWSGWNHSQVDTQSVGKLLSEVCCQKDASRGVPGDYVQSLFYLIFPLATWMMEEKSTLMKFTDSSKEVICRTGLEFKMILMHWSGVGSRGEGEESRARESFYI